MIRNMRPFTVTALLAFAGAVSPSAAMAQSYSGNWPVNVTLPPQFAHTACITLLDNGADGAHHSGPASISGPLVGGTLSYGTFQVVNKLLVATIQSGSDSGQNAGLVFIGPANDGEIGAGVFENVYGGENFLSGALTFGKNGGC